MKSTAKTDHALGAPAIVSAAALKDSIRVEPLTCAIGAELSNVNLGVAARTPELMTEIRALLLEASSALLP